MPVYIVCNILHILCCIYCCFGCTLYYVFDGVVYAFVGDDVVLILVLECR